jgi:hypothetical protein
MRLLSIFIVLLITATNLHSQAAPGNAETAFCTFQDGKQISVRYNPQGPAGKKELPRGEMWPPSGSPMYLFTEAAISISNTEIPVGAYSMYVIPEKKQWTLIINKSVNEGKAYQQQQDIVRAALDTGNLGEPAEQIKLAFGHLAPKQCNLRIYYGKTGAWAEFKEK